MAPPPEGAEAAGLIGITPPFVYFLHGCDDDIFRPSFSYGLLASLIQPARVSAVVCGEDCAECGSLKELAAMYLKRLLDDVRNHSIQGEGPKPAPGSERLVFLGYGAAAGLAHEVARQAKDRGRSVALLLLDSEVSWPPRPSTERMGGYEWLGGDIEAALLACRALGARAFAQREVKALTAQKPEVRDADDVKMRAYWELAGSTGLPQSRFDESVQYTSRTLESLCGKLAEPSADFAGDALLVTAADSPEFAAAEEVNRQYCSGLQTAQVPGSHYGMCQGQQAHGTAAVIVKFLVERGFYGDDATRVAAKTRKMAEEDASPVPRGVRGLSVLHSGEEGKPVVYITQGAAAGAPPKEWLQEVASLLAPCRVAALEHDEEAQLCGSSAAAAEVYNKRILSDLNTCGRGGRSGTLEQID